MPPNASSATSNVPEECSEQLTAHLDDPKELQAKIVAETKAINKAAGIEEKIVKERTGLLDFGTPIIWTNAIAITIFHILALYYMLTFPWIQKWKLVVWGYCIGILGGLGVTGGAHRYWTHKTYKANIPMRILLMLAYCSAGENSIYDWVRDHRVHHKFSETDADPHNSNRGFFFAHVGWLMLRKHPEVIRKGREVDMSDIRNEPVAAFSEKYFVQLKLLMCFILPVVIPVYWLGEDWYHSLVSEWFMRYPLLLNITWSVNSAAHLWGAKPYDKNISPVENRLVAFWAMGEGWHNYHHVFPWDYKTAEFGNYQLNMTTMFLDFFALLGWVYDRKEPSRELVQAVVNNRGDGSHGMWEEVPEPELKNQLKSD